MTATATIITPACMFCQQAGTLTVTREQADRLQAGEFAQEVLPDIGPDRREQIINGTHPQCWDAIFG